MKDNRYYILSRKYFQGTISKEEGMELSSFLKEKPENYERFMFWEEEYALEALKDEKLYLKWCDFSKGIHSYKRVSLVRRLGVFLLSKKVASILLVGLSVFLLFIVFIKRDTEAENTRIIEYYSGNGEIKTILLPDSSIVTLNSDAYLYLPEMFEKTNRIVHLEGEAFFEVKKDRENPFCVKTRDLEVKVLGTSFNVSAYNSSEKSYVTLVSGIVEVSINQTGEDYLLSPFERIMYDGVLKEVAINIEESSNIANWRNRELIFDDLTLGEILPVLEKRFNVSISVGSKNTILSQRINVKFMADEDLESILETLNRLIPELQYKIE